VSWKRHTIKVDGVMCKQGLNYFRPLIPVHGAKSSFKAYDTGSIKQVHHYTMD